MIATQDVVTQAADVVNAVVGSPPDRIGTVRRQPGLAVGALAVQSALWGVALGLLAPATTALVLVSGLAAPAASVVGSTDAGFFFGFVPLLAAVITVLLALHHWPLRDLRAFHRELALGLLLVGAVTLVGLRSHGAAVTGDDWKDAWLFANGSLVLHALATWCLVRLATAQLTVLHARRAGWQPAARPSPKRNRELSWDAPRHAATAALGLQAVVWGVVIGIAAGAAAGTVVRPGPGTLAGAYVGAIYGLVPTVLGAVALVTVISWRRDTDAIATARAITATVSLVGAATLAAGWSLLLSAPQLATAWPTGHPARTWLLGAVVVVLLLRHATPRLTNAYLTHIPPPADPASPARPHPQTTSRISPPPHPHPHRSPAPT
jgi:hypothetical protein